MGSGGLSHGEQMGVVQSDGMPGLRAMYFVLHLVTTLPLSSLMVNLFFFVPFVFPTIA